MELDAILILTNQCNLNCAYCVYACDLNPDPYFITIKELQHTLSLMKQKLPSLRTIFLSGGDPFMHPLILQICKTIRDFFPYTELCIFTNGLLLNKISDADIIDLTKNLNINIVTSLYPSINNLEEYKKQDKRFKEIDAKLFYQFSHLYFIKTNYKYDDKTDVSEKIINDQFNTTCHGTLTKYNNLITIYRNKILVCCGEVGYLNNNKDVDKNDLLDLNTLSDEQEIINFCEKPHNICKACVVNQHNSDSSILWAKKSLLTKKYQTINLKQIFVENYADYKILYLENNEHLVCYRDDFFYNKLNTREKEYFDIKYKKGLADIFIPYDNNLSQKTIIDLYNKLMSFLNIETYNLYFVGINSSSKINDIMFTNFYQSSFDAKLKSTFLLSNSLTHGYEEFLQYSYLNKKILLDINNFILTGEL